MESNQETSSSSRIGGGNLDHYTVAMIDAPLKNDPLEDIDPRNEELLKEAAKRQRKI